MILYLDTSALIKRYIAEPGTHEVSEAIATAEIVGTSLISRAETAAALAKAVRMGALTRRERQTGPRAGLPVALKAGNQGMSPKMIHREALSGCSPHR